MQPNTLSRDQHNVSRKDISKNALKVLYRLNEAGYASYLVGGGVRDLLLEQNPKDFDIATDASPEDIKALFKNCRLIGRRFRLALWCLVVTLLRWPHSVQLTVKVKVVRLATVDE